MSLILIKDGSSLIKKYLEEAKTIIEDKGIGSQEFEALRRKAAGDPNPFIRNLLMS